MSRLNDSMRRRLSPLTLYRRVPNAWLSNDHYWLVRLDIVMQAQRHARLPLISPHSDEQPMSQQWHKHHAANPFAMTYKMQTNQIRSLWFEFCVRPAIENLP